MLLGKHNNKTDIDLFQDFLRADLISRTESLKKLMRDFADGNMKYLKKQLQIGDIVNTLSEEAECQNQD